MCSILRHPCHRYLYFSTHYSIAFTHIFYSCSCFSPLLLPLLSYSSSPTASVPVSQFLPSCSPTPGPLLLLPYSCPLLPFLAGPLSKLFLRTLLATPRLRLSSSSPSLGGGKKLDTCKFTLTFHGEVLEDNCFTRKKNMSILVKQILGQNSVKCIFT